MLKNLFYVITYIAALFITYVIVILINVANPELSNETLNLWLQIGFSFVALGLFVGIFKTYLISQYKDFRNRMGTLVALGVLGFFIMYMISIILNIVIYEVIGVTEQAGNQEAIEGMFSGLSSIELILFVITIAIVTPIVEELTFRKGLYGFFGKFVMWFGEKVNPEVRKDENSTLFKIASISAIVLSGLAFGFVHVYGSGDYIFLISYGGSGMVLGAIYHYSGRNVYVTTITHIIQNSLGVLIMFLL